MSPRDADDVKEGIAGSGRRRVGITVATEVGSDCSLSVGGEREELGVFFIQQLLPPLLNTTVALSRTQSHHVEKHTAHSSTLFKRK